MKAAIMITKNSPGSSSAIRIKSSVEVALEPSISQGFPRRKFSETPFFLWVQQLSKIKRCIPHPQNNLPPALYVCARRGKNRERRRRGDRGATALFLGDHRNPPVKSYERRRDRSRISSSSASPTFERVLLNTSRVRARKGVNVHGLRTVAISLRVVISGLCSTVLMQTPSPIRGKDREFGSNPGGFRPDTLSSDGDHWWKGKTEEVKFGSFSLGDVFDREIQKFGRFAFRGKTCK